MIRNVIAGAATLAVGLALLVVVGLHNLRRRPPVWYTSLGERHTDG